MILTKYIRSCAICQNYLPPVDWLCSLCWKVLEREYLSLPYIYRAEKQLPHLRLLDWHEDNNKLIQLFIRSLKQGGPDFIFKRIGLEMASRFLHFKLWKKTARPVFIPAPPRCLQSEKDHAFQLARALSFYLGGELKNPLKRAHQWSSQKTKSRHQRAKIQMQKQEELNEERPIVFVDDVLTTGSTARKAFQTLNQPLHFFVFTLAWRRPELEERD